MLRGASAPPVRNTETCPTATLRALIRRLAINGSHSAEPTTPISVCVPTALRC